MSMTRVRLLPFIALAVALSACQEGTATGPDQRRPNDIVLGASTVAAPLVGTNWSLRDLPGLSLVAARDSVRPLRFSQAPAGRLTLSTSLGCNSMGGTVDTVGTRLRVQELHTTLIGCESALASLESGYSTVLREVAYFGVRGDTLWLYDEGLRIRARYRALR